MYGACNNEITLFVKALEHQNVGALLGLFRADTISLVNWVKTTVKRVELWTFAGWK